MRGLTAIALTLALVAPMTARAETLADVRAELSVLYQEFQRLQSELSPTGPANALASDATTLERMNTIEAELQRLTQKTEQLEFRITRLVQDGTNRVGDLEFRICELDPECDIASLAETPTLGGEVVAQLPAPLATPAPDTSQLAVGEQADFDAAKAAFDSGDFQAAATLFETFSNTYPGGPLAAPANLMRGQAHASLGQMAPAARAYLNAFSSAPDGPEAPQALYRLGVALADLGQQSEACVTLDEVGIRFPGAGEASQAAAARQNLGCS